MIIEEIPGVVVKPLTYHGDPRGWLGELFRVDELPDGLRPVMAYLSLTHPNVVRGPHEHTRQTDIFCFIGVSTFRLYLWDNRPNATAYRRLCTAEFGENNPMLVIVPPGVVHAYKNIGTVDGLVFNAPDRLYKGDRRTEAVDEIRHESDPHMPFVIGD
jgi:dTDP-4-dehydrorhamnose 3,5-epimerase